MHEHCHHILYLLFHPLWIFKAEVELGWQMAPQQLQVKCISLVSLQVNFQMKLMELLTLEDLLRICLKITFFRNLSYCLCYVTVIPSPSWYFIELNIPSYNHFATRWVTQSICFGWTTVAHKNTFFLFYIKLPTRGWAIQSICYTTNNFQVAYPWLPTVPSFVWGLVHDYLCWWETEKVHGWASAQKSF